jgi:hypothetical protein
MRNARVSDEARLARTVLRLGGGLVVATAAVVGAVRGWEDALGVLVGGALSLGNFQALRWVAGLVLEVRATAPARSARQLLWVGAAAARFGLWVVCLGYVLTQGWVGTMGLLVSLVVLPLAVIAAGLGHVRTAWGSR